MEESVSTDFACPACSRTLDWFESVDGRFASCPGCGGYLLGSTILVRIAGPRPVEQLFDAASKSEVKSARNCSKCAKPMRILRASPSGKEVEIDLCLSCFWIWFDREEVELVADRMRERLELGIPALAPWRATIEASGTGQSAWDDGDADIFLSILGGIIKFIFGVF